MEIISGCEIFNNHPYYIGQHWGKNVDSYFGSGVIWNKCLKKIRNIDKDWKKFVKKEILFIGDVNQNTLNILEKVYIKKYSSIYELKLGGCNITDGGNNACPSKSFEARRKIKESHLGSKNPIHKHIFSSEERECLRNRRLGFKMSEESKRKISEARKGIKFSESHRKKISEATCGEKNPNFGKRGKETSMFGRKQTEYQKSVMRKRMAGSNNPMFGKPPKNKGKKMSEEQKEKISKALKGRKIDESKILRGEKHWAYGKHFSDETKRKMSKALKGRKMSLETREKIRIATLKRYGKL